MWEGHHSCAENDVEPRQVGEESNQAGFEEQCDVCMRVEHTLLAN